MSGVQWVPWLLPFACRLVEALRDFGYLDWQLSALVCKTLWNYSDKMTSSLSCFGAEETELLIEQLEVYLGVCVCVCVCVRVCACARVCVRCSLEHPGVPSSPTYIQTRSLLWNPFLKVSLKRPELSSMTCGGVSSVLWLSHSWSVWRHTPLILSLYSMTRCI